MAKKCDILGTGVMSGNNVSHANNKTRRRFLPNLQVVSLFSEALNRVFKMKVCSKTLRSIEHNGGLDSYLEKTSNTKLTEEAKKIKEVKGVVIADDTETKPAKTVKSRAAAKKTAVKTAAKKTMAKKKNSAKKSKAAK